jgi:phospholipid/cholesterol/gamma-HCH transport system substrate-binding protein
MRRIAVMLLLVAGVAGLALSAPGASEGGSYQVRAIFDNGSFLVKGEEVRVAGANVGTIAEVDVSRPDEVVHEDGSAESGKAVVVLQIDNPGFQNFREDASCIIRPQSLLGEKFVDCEPTQPRAPGSEPPPELAQIAEGEPGEGQYLLPVERTMKAVDLDLVNNIMEEPYPDRFRLILNEFGAGLAARGDELEEIVERANPALRQTNQVLAILARQNRELANLASDGDASLAPLARERERLGGFINAAAETAQATAERREELEAGFERLPTFLRELRLTMPRLANFSDQAQPTLADFQAAAPALTRATEALGPFSRVSTGALTSLGDAAEASQENIVNSDPILVDLRNLAKDTKPGAANLKRLLSTMRRTDGFEYVTRLIYNSVGIANGFDSLGHFMRALLPLNNCVDYELTIEGGCGAQYIRPATTRAKAAAQERAVARLMARLGERGGRRGGRNARAAATVLEQIAPLLDQGAGSPAAEPADPAAPTEPEAPQPEPDPEPQPEPDQGSDGSQGGDAVAPDARSGEAPRVRDMRALLDFLIEPAGRAGR